MLSFSFCSFLSEMEEMDLYCGKAGYSAGGKWFVALKMEKGDAKGYFTGILISKQFVLTAAEIFFEANFDANPQDWKADIQAI